jgi:nucleoside diphosphate kinase
MADSSTPGPRGKVARLLSEYELPGLGEYLEDRWTAEDATDRASLRALADEFNVRLLEATLADADGDPGVGTAERYYEALTGDDVSRGTRTQVRRTLEQAGLDVEALRTQFVSRQAIHTYLTKTRGVSSPQSSTSVSPSAVRETIDRLRERTRQVTTSRIERLRSAGTVSIGEFRVIVDVQVYCTDCGTQLGITELLGDRSCDCDE